MAGDAPLEGLLGPAETNAASAAGDGLPARRVIAQLADDVLPTLIARLDRSRLGELEVRQDGWRIRLRRAEPNPPDGAEPVPVPRRSERRADRQASEKQADGQADGRPQPLRPTDRGTLTVASPAVGYYQPGDGLTIGNTVRAGDLLGHVDVLGVRQEVVAPDDGLLSALEAEAGEAVEYGQPLARLERQDRRA